MTHQQWTADGRSGSMSAPERVVILSSRLRLREFEMSDAEDVYACITPAITRFMFWEPPQSFAAYTARREATLRVEKKNDFSFVIRLVDTLECLGITAVENIGAASPELGIWLKESAHGLGYGTEAVRAVADWASRTLGKRTFVYPVAVQNVASRKIAEGLGGKIVGTRTSAKYDSVVYNIRWNGSSKVR